MSSLLSNGTGGTLDELLLLQYLLPQNENDVLFDRFISPSSSSPTHHHMTHHLHQNHKSGLSSIPVDILETHNEYHFFMDVPGLSKTDIQVTVEDNNTLVIRSNGKRIRESNIGEEKGSNNQKNGKRKRESSNSDEDEGCKYIRLERRARPKFVRKFRLPENSNVSAITAKCENGVLTVTVEKLPPPPKPNTVQVTIS